MVVGVIAVLCSRNYSSAAVLCSRNYSLAVCISFQMSSYYCTIFFRHEKSLRNFAFMPVRFGLVLYLLFFLLLGALGRGCCRKCSFYPVPSAFPFISLLFQDCSRHRLCDSRKLCLFILHS
ncbi:hypothetical protein ACH5RR_004188 [Cinchona calisaya]|uniref:Uncharacterized protein n=1 Tax=Cinchona calisaya TaxID=153742 RepID=A0ABD3AWY1_9GENT